MRDGRTGPASAVVTGASSGIGAAVAVRCAGRGRRVILSGRDPDRLAMVADRTGATVVPGDLTEPDVIDALRRAAGDEVGLLVHAAGIGAVGPFGDMTASALDRVLAVDLLAPVRLTHALLPALRAGHGHVVVVASIAAIGVAGEAAYSTAKGGLRVFADALRLETGLGVTTVLPGIVDTGFHVTPVSRRHPRSVSADAVAVALLRGVESGRAEVFVPRWLSIAARVHGVAPATFARLARLYTVASVHHT